MFDSPSSRDSLPSGFEPRKPESLLVLLIDSDREDRRSIKKYLTEIPGVEYVIIEAETASEGICLWRENKPHLILLQYDSSAIGEEFIGYLLREESKNGSPLVLLTETEGQSLPLTALRARVCDFIVKGVLSSGNLHAIIDRAIGKNRYELKRGELALQESQERFRTLADNISQFAWMADETGALFWYNQRWYEYTGTTFEEMEGWGWQKVHHPEHVERVTERFKNFVGTGELWEDTFPLRGKDGKYRWFLSRAMPIKDGNGRVVRWFGTNTDIDDLKRTEAELEESKRILDALMEYIPEGITLADAPDVKIRRISKYGRELTGGPAENIEGIPAEDHTQRGEIYYPDGITRPDPQQLPLSRAVRRGEVVLDEEWVLQRPDAQKIYLLCNAAPIRDAEGRVTGGIIAWRDINDRKQAELLLKQQAEELERLNATLQQTAAKLRERNQELDRFTYTVSHDLKAPLRGISSLAGWLSEDLEDQLSGENLHNLQTIQRRVARMDELIDGLLAYSRIGRAEIPSEWVEVERLLREVIDSLAPPPAFTISIEPGMPTLTTKKLFLSQVFSNLISNAIKHCERSDGRVEIRAARSGNQYEFSVSDNGAGIPPEYHQKIFEMFQSFKGGEGGENTGIGLSLVKKIVETEGGTIKVESSPGNGATFRFTWNRDP